MVYSLYNDHLYNTPILFSDVMILYIVISANYLENIFPDRKKFLIKKQHETTRFEAFMVKDNKAEQRFMKNLLYLRF